MNKPLYKKKPIGSLTSLAKLLSIDEDQLVSLAENASDFYYLHKRIKKSDGSYREIYGVLKPLKSLQQKINEKIYCHVYFPPYLHGAIKSRDSRRNHITDASVHVNATLIAKMDISNFFPSLTSKIIFDIWKRFFNFPPSVALLLTKLTTFNGFLTQGAPTSSGLANLAFWDIEATVVEKLNNDGFRYTRFVDDITVSSETYIEKQKLEPVFSTVFGMFHSKGVKPNRKKIKISTSGQNMSVHNLNINSGRPTISKGKRKIIKAAVKACEKHYLEDNRSKAYEELWKSTLGKVNYLRQLHSTKAQEYIERLEAIQPKPS